MFLHDTKQKKLVQLKPINKGRIGMFVCGPTVQDHFHIGHARTYIFFDTMAKYLRVAGYSVFYLQNITDVDDKIIKRASEENIDPIELSKMYAGEYYTQMRQLRVDSVNLYARATDHIPEIISQIKRLVSQDKAYIADDGVYFDVRSFSSYGEISGQDLDQVRHGVRKEINKNKRNPEDFVIWKKMKPGEPCWDSPWGKGRPGWHIEDTAITELYLGAEYDIHGAGTDLIFPHHEAENAIGRSLSGKKHLARYWIHSGMLNINSEKMSKSLKNYTTISEILHNHSPEVLRFALLNAGYRTMLNFSEEMLESSSTNVDYISKLYRKLKNIRKEKGDFAFEFGEAENRIMKLMDNDFDTRGSIKEILSIASSLNSNIEEIGSKSAESAMKFFEWADSFLGILAKDETSLSANLVPAILEIRRILREKKEFELSDRIRAELKASGIYIEDTDGGTEWWFE